jgi:hypothetical protein
MLIRELLKRLEGIQTIDTVMSILNVNRQKAVYYIHRLRKEGYVRTQYSPLKKRVYHISFEIKQGGTSYYEIINKHSPIKLSITQTYKIYGREVTLEETLIFAIKSKKIRVVLASLSLFRKISDWKLLYKLAKTNGVERKVGVLYDLSRQLKIRTRRMDGRFRRLMLPKPYDRFQFILEGNRTREEKYKKIENLWRVYIPFNKSDLVDYL